MRLNVSKFKEGHIFSRFTNSNVFLRLIRKNLRKMTISFLRSEIHRILRQFKDVCKCQYIYKAGYGKINDNNVANYNYVQKCVKRYVTPSG